MRGYQLANLIARNLLEFHEHEGNSPAACYELTPPEPVQFAGDTALFYRYHAPVDNAKAYWWRYASPTGFRVATGELCGPGEGYFRPDLSGFQLGFVAHFLELKYGVTYTVELENHKVHVVATDGAYTADNKVDEDAVRSSHEVIAEALYDFFIALKGEWEAAGKVVPFSRW